MSHDRKPASRVAGEIRVQGMLRLAPDTLYEGDVHAPGGLVAKPGSIVAGDVYTDGTVQIAPTARIGGRIHPVDSGPPRARATGCLARLLALTREDQAPSEARLERSLDQLAHELLEEAPGEAWSLGAVRDGLFGQALARLAPVTIEQEAEDAFLLRIRAACADTPSGGGDRLAAVSRLARHLGEAARPGLSLHPLSSAGTSGDVVLLVES